MHSIAGLATALKGEGGIYPLFDEDLHLEFACLVANQLER